MADAWEGEAIEDWYASDVASSDNESIDAESEAAGSEQGAEEVDHDERASLLRAPVLSICSALGGYEHVEVDGRLELVYRLGDDCLECLRDLRRLWRQDDTDSSRAIARVFAELGTMHNDLIPILLHAAGEGEKADKIALACTDLMTALTWPIDWHAEVKDIVTREEDDQVLSKLVELQSAQVQYKASVLRVRAKEHRLVNRTVVSCVMKSLLLPALAKPRSERSEREVGVIGMCLHFFRNLLAIRDPVAHTLSSTALVANATLQSMLVEQLDASHVMDTLLMLASNADAKEYEAWAPVAADCIYQLYLGSDVKEIARVEHASVGAQSSALAASLDSEARRKRHTINNARHSRFGTTIQFTAHDGSVRVARQQPALVESISELEQSIADRSKRRVSRKRPATERGGVRRYTAWTPAGRAVLRRWADRFLQDGAFAVLEKQYLRDIHAERERIGDLDAARCKALQLATFFLEYFLARRADDASAWDFSMVAEWLEPWAFRLARARTAISLEAKEWLEFGAGVRLWTALLRLLDALAHGDEDQRQVADELQNTLYYDGDLLDTSLQVMHAYSAQSFACLETVLDFAYTMPRLLEKHASQREYMFVKQRRSKEEESTQQSERLFRFQTFQRAMATTRLAHVCTQYLGRWRDSAQPATMLTRLASVAHRIAVKATRPDLFFSAKARAVWVRLLRDPESEMAAVDAKAHTSLVQLATYLKRKFAKLDTSAQEAFDADKRPAREPKADKAPADIMVKPGLVHAEEIGVAVGLLGEQHKLAAVTWVKFHLEMASAARKALMASDPDADPAAPSAEVLDQFATHNEMQADATRHPVVKLLLRLVGLEAEVVGDHLEWSVPRTVTPAALDRDARIIDQYLAQPLLIEGELSEQVQRLRAPRPRAEGQGDTSPKKKRQETKEKRQRAPRVPKWLENEFIEDSDEELAFAMADVPRTSSRSSSPHRVFSDEQTPDRVERSPHTSPSTPKRARASPSASPSAKRAALASLNARRAGLASPVKAHTPAHRDPLFLFDSDNE